MSIFATLFHKKIFRIILNYANKTATIKEQYSYRNYEKLRQHEKDELKLHCSGNGDYQH